MEGASKDKRPEYLILIGALLISVSVAAGVFVMLRFKSPTTPADLKIVKLSAEIPSYFDNIFRPSEIASPDFLQNDPVTIVRSKPFFPEVMGLGPHDLLGFRNRVVPRIADVVVIGDSQTYGNNALLEDNWPSVLARALSPKSASVYSMATGGWALPQYLDMYSKCGVFQPYSVVIALYTGNDARETLRAVYSIDRFRRFRKAGISLDSFEEEKTPDPATDRFSTSLPDGTVMTFTPERRLFANRRSDPAVSAGFELISQILGEMNSIASGASWKVYVTILPTKELVFSPLLKGSGTAVPAAFDELIQNESENISEIKTQVSTLPNLHYLDLIPALQRAAAENALIYPPDQDGHPLPSGYEVIGELVAAELNKDIPEALHGMAAVEIGPDKKAYYLVTGNGARVFESAEVLGRNGWVEKDIPVVPYRRVAAIPVVERVFRTDPAELGPQSVK